MSEVGWFGWGLKGMKGFVARVKAQAAQGTLSDAHLRQLRAMGEVLVSLPEPAMAEKPAPVAAPRPLVVQPRPCTCDKIPPEGQPWSQGYCPECTLYYRNPRYQRLWSGEATPKRRASAAKPRIQKGKPHCPECVKKKQSAVTDNAVELPPERVAGNSGSTPGVG